VTGQTWDNYFLQIAFLVATRSSCQRHQVGAVAVSPEHRILATGYNGAPSKVPHCSETGCRKEGADSGAHHELCIGVHAEQNVIAQGALYGVSLRGSTVYCTHQPCVLCAKMLINVKVERVAYCIAYPDRLGLELLGEVGVKVDKLQKPTAPEKPKEALLFEERDLSIPTCRGCEHFDINNALAHATLQTYGEIGVCKQVYKWLVSHHENHLIETLALRKATDRCNITKRSLPNVAPGHHH